jgi:hypothetical protein
VVEVAQSLAEEQRAPAPDEAQKDGRGHLAIAIQFEVHDRQQLEIRVAHRLDQAEEHLFKVDTYFFIPRNIGINASNYPKEDFYADVNALMRLEAPALSLDRLADPGDEGSPLSRIVDALEEFRSTKRTPASSALAVHVKLYAYVHTEAVRREVKRLKDLLPECSYDKNGARERFLSELHQSLSQIQRSLWAYRRVRAELWPFERLCHHSLVEAMSHADEYMSLFLEEQLGKLCGALEADVRRLDGSAFVPRATATIAALARSEAEHRAKYDFLLLKKEQDEPGEYFGYRSSLLKKSVHQALYLDARKARGDTFVRNAVGSVGAALAAIWALATQLPATVADLSGGTKMTFFALAVVAYVLKDRIKVFTNEYLSARLRRSDHTHNIVGPSLAVIGLGMLDVKLRETMRFFSLNDVREKVRQIRLERRTVRQTDVLQEEVLHYRKSLQVENTQEEERLPEGYGVRDIMRFNMRHFLLRLDDPVEKVRYFDAGRDAFHEAKLPKVYHLNVVTRARHVRKGRPQLERYEHLRVVLDKNGIVRVDKIDPL